MTILARQKSTAASALYLVSFLLPMVADASVCQSTSDGSFGDPLVWDCGCDPTACDTLLIDHLLTLEEDILLQCVLTIGEEGALVSTGLLEHRGELVNHGRLEASRLFTYLPGGLNNDGDINAGYYDAIKAPILNFGTIAAEDSLWLYSAGVLNNYGTIAGGNVRLGYPCYNYGQVHAIYLVSGSMINIGSIHTRFMDLRSTVIFNDGMFYADTVFCANSIENGEMATFTCDQFIQLGDLENYGILRVFGTFYNGNDTAEADSQMHTGSVTEAHNFINTAGSILRGPGTLCIAELSENHGILGGPMGICDATPTSTSSPYMDIHTGTVSSLIIECWNTTCSTVGINDRPGEQTLSLFPQPAHAFFTVELGGHREEISSLLLVDATGRKVQSQSRPFGVRTIVHCEALPAGHYVLVGLEDGERRVFTAPVVLVGD